jgi:CDP-glucose 4,6-dehydratase
VIQDNAKAEIRDQYLDATRAKQRLGWSARYTLDEGLAETIAWYEHYLQGTIRPVTI